MRSPPAVEADPGSLRLRSLVVSLASTALDLGLFVLCTLAVAGTALVWARWLCGAVGALGNFALNRGWAFRARPGGGRQLGRQLGRYAATAAVSVTLATTVWWLLRTGTGWDPRLLHPLSLALVWLAFTFPMLRRWVFRPAVAVG